MKQHTSHRCGRLRETLAKLRAKHAIITKAIRALEAYRKTTHAPRSAER